MSKIVGIDLGTTNSLVATVDSGIPLVIADGEGQRLTPSVVHFPKDESPVVGRAANRIRAVKPAETIYSIKRFMGRRASEIADDERHVTYPLTGNGNGPVEIPIHGRAWTPEEVSAEILKKLKADAEAFFSEPVSRAVITVPAYFNDAQRNATKKAGELAGLTVERIINEPTAAALAYGLDKLRERSKIAVYDLGGGTFDLSILELTEGVFQVLATNGNTRLGGDDIDQRIVSFLLQKIAASGGPDLSLSSTVTAKGLSALARIREAAETAKISLSTDTTANITLPFLMPEFSFDYQLTRAELEKLARPVVERTREHCLRALADAKLQPGDLDQVILVGGQTRMPLVRSYVSEMFGCSDFEEQRGTVRLGATFHRGKGPQLNTSASPEEAVALGAAIQAEILAGGYKHVLLLDVTPLSLGIETFGGLMNVIIPRNTTIPSKAGEMFTTAVDNQHSMLIHVLQGERERAKDNWTLGKFTIEFPPGSRGTARVGVQFEIDANGILHVLARDTKTGQEKTVEMKSAVDVDDAEVQKMVDQSVEHAFDDMRARQWIETRLRAEETLKATEKALTDCADEMDGPYKVEVETAAKQVRDLMQAEGTGDPARLKAALQNLDEVTKPLADLLMDKAMEAMLKKRGLIS
jgi:molecular chaperone DnaK